MQTVWNQFEPNLCLFLHLQIIIVKSIVLISQLATEFALIKHFITYNGRTMAHYHSPDE